MNVNIENREAVIRALTRELVGPAPEGEPLGSFVFEKREDAYGPFVDKETGEEIIQRDTPSKRYGVAVLHPFGTLEENELTHEGEKDLVDADANSTEETGANRDATLKKVDLVQEKLYKKVDDNDPDELDLSPANSFKPSSIGVSFLAEFSPESRLVVEATGGRYESIDIQIAGKNQGWWVRKSVLIHAEFSGASILNAKQKKIRNDVFEIQNQKNLNLRVEL